MSTAELPPDEKKREERFKALDATREAFKDVPDEELEREIARAVTLARQRKQRSDPRT